MIQRIHAVRHQLTGRAHPPVEDTQQYPRTRRAALHQQRQPAKPQDFRRAQFLHHRRVLPYVPECLCNILPLHQHRRNPLREGVYRLNDVVHQQRRENRRYPVAKDEQQHRACQLRHQADGILFLQPLPIALAVVLHAPIQERNEPQQHRHADKEQQHAQPERRAHALFAEVEHAAAALPARHNGLEGYACARPRLRDCLHQKGIDGCGRFNHTVQRNIRRIRLIFPDALGMPRNADDLVAFTIDVHLAPQRIGDAKQLQRQVLVQHSDFPPALQFLFIRQPSVAQELLPHLKAIFSDQLHARIRRDVSAGYRRFFNHTADCPAQHRRRIPFIGCVLQRLHLIGNRLIRRGLAVLVLAGIVLRLLGGRGHQVLQMVAYLLCLNRPKHQRGSKGGQQRPLPPFPQLFHCTYSMTVAPSSSARSSRSAMER